MPLRAAGLGRATASRMRRSARYSPRSKTTEPASWSSLLGTVTRCPPCFVRIRAFRAAFRTRSTFPTTRPRNSRASRRTAPSPPLACASRLAWAPALPRPSAQSMPRKSRATTAAWQSGWSRRRPPGSRREWIGSCSWGRPRTPKLPGHAVNSIPETSRSARRWGRQWTRTRRPTAPKRPPKPTTVPSLKNLSKNARRVMPGGALKRQRKRSGKPSARPRRSSKLRRWPSSRQWLGSQRPRPTWQSSSAR
mmetsp:Transcript_1088/g.2326  ORF Transcript_1088/g.2326 Transcript_1088/m.2326 type:complete len:250 (-) Transcript_1088:817-1566(-)